MPAGTVTFLVARLDAEAVAGTAREAMNRVVSSVEEIFDSSISGRWDGHLERNGEPGEIVAVFVRASDALAAAVEIQLALAAKHSSGSGWTTIRMGIHTGDAELERGRYSGPSIAHARRLRDVAHGGQVLVSGATADVAGDRLPDGAHLIDLGAHWVKELQRRQRVYQLSHQSLRGVFPPLGSLVTVPNNLPAQPTSFIGRHLELTELSELLVATRALTLAGPGGCGKTRLAVELASDRAERYADGVWWVQLAAVGSGGDVAGAAMTALSIDDARGLTPVERLTAHLSNDRALLVLDNCEHVRDGCAELVDTLLGTCGGLTVMSTSREPLGFPEESVWRVRPLAHPQDARASSPESLDSFDATRLFIDRAVDARPNFRVTNENAPAVAEICARLDGIPLAIELAAARVRVLTVERILEGLDDRFRLLTVSVGTDDARQQTLRASVEWSHDLLSEAERALFRRLSVFAGGFVLDAAERVCSDETLDQVDVLDLVSQLVDKSLVLLDDAREVRYRMLETIRRFAEEQLLEAGEAGVVRDRHLEFYLSLAEEYEPELERTASPSLLDRFEAERENFYGAIQWTLDKGDAASALRLSGHLVMFWVLRGHYWEGQSWLRRALAAEGSGSEATRARALWALGQVSLVGMDVESGFGLSATHEAVSAARESGDEVILARCVYTLAFAESVMMPAVARNRLEEALSDFRRLGDPWGLGWGLMSIGYLTSFFWDRHDEARPIFDELRSIGTETGNRHFLAWCDGAEGVAAVRRGRYEEGRAKLESTLAFSRDLNEPVLEMASAMVLGDLEIAQGRYEAAKRLVAESRDRLWRSGRGRLEAVDLRLAAARLAEGDVESARSVCDALAVQLEGFPIPYFSAKLSLLLGRIRTEERDLEGARAQFQAALEIARSLDNPWVMGQVLCEMGRVLRAEGNAVTSEDHHHQALALQMQHRFIPDAIDSLESIAGIAITGESWAEGTRLLAAAAVARDEIGSARQPVIEPLYQGDIDAARKALGDEALSIAWTEGALLSLEQAVAYASRARGERRRPSSGWASLTPVETEVVRLASRGLTNPEIAERLFITRATVKTHLAHVFAKLGVSNRAELASEATRRGI